MDSHEKTRASFRIIAGIRPAWVQWRVFYPNEEVPARDKELGESVQQYHDRVGILVRQAACEWLANLVDPKDWVVDLA